MANWRSATGCSHSCIALQTTHILNVPASVAHSNGAFHVLTGVVFSIPRDQCEEENRVQYRPLLQSILILLSTALILL